jgi:tetratricopeptide (TPR) repeat protein
MENNKEHISSREFEAYLSGKMSASERAAFESRVQNDPFAQEALEGYLLLEDNKKAVGLIRDTDNLIEAVIGVAPPAKRINLSYFKFAAMAAILVLAFGVFFWSTKLLENNEQMAQAEMAEEELIEAVTEDVEFEAPRPDTETIYFFDDDNARKDKVRDNTDRFTEHEIKEPIKKTEALVVESKPEKPVKKEERSLMADVKPEKTTQEAAKKEQKPVVAAPEQVQPAVSSANKLAAPVKSDVSAGAAPIEKSPFDLGMEQFRKNNFQEAIKFFNESIRSNSRVMDSYFYSGLSYSRISQNSNAIRSFDVVIRDGKSQLVGNAKWHKAEVLIKQGEKEEAKEILRDLVETDSQYKTPAKELLKTL